MESETGLIFQASTPKSKMKPYMILKSTEAIAAQDAFPRRATVLFRRMLIEKLVKLAMFLASYMES